MASLMLALVVVSIVMLAVGICWGRADRRTAPVAYIEPRWVSRTRKS